MQTACKVTDFFWHMQNKCHSWHILHKKKQPRGLLFFLPSLPLPCISLSIFLPDPSKKKRQAIHVTCLFFPSLSLFSKLVYFFLNLFPLHALACLFFLPTLQENRQPPLISLSFSPLKHALSLPVRILACLFFTQLFKKKETSHPCSLSIFRLPFL